MSSLRMNPFPSITQAFGTCTYAHACTPGEFLLYIQHIDYTIGLEGGAQEVK